MLIIPTYNEKRNIEPLLRAIREHAGNIPVFFIDDSSPDGTAAEIRRLSASDPQVRLLIRGGKMGLGRAYLDAFKLVIEEGSADFVITMDGDLSHPAEKIPELIAALETRDFAIGSRYVAGGSVANWNWPRRMISKIGNLFAEFFSGLRIKDLTAGFVAYKVAALKKIELESIRSEGYAFQVEMKNRLVRSGASHAEIPIEFRERAAGKSKFGSGIIAEGIFYLLKAAAKNRRLLGSAALFAASFAVYALTAPHSVYLNDNGEFITVARTLGIPHPSGYPLYVLLAWIFAHLPLGPIPLRVNLFSAFFAAAALVLLKKLVQKFARPWLAEKSELFSIFAALTLGFSQIFWLQATVAKIYPLNLFLMLLMFHYGLRCFEQRRNSDLLKLGLISGLAAANHQMSLLFLPVLLPILFFYRRQLPALAKAAALFILGLAPYLYLLIRPHFHPVYNWGRIASWRDFIREVSRAQYNDFSLAGSLGDKRLYFSAFWIAVWAQFGGLGLAALPGAIGLVKKYKSRLYLSLGLIFANSLLVIALRSGPYSFEGAEFYSTYYLPAFAAIIMLSVTGLAWIAHRIKALRAIALILLLLSAGFEFRSNLPIRNFRNFSFIENYYDNGLKSLPANSVLLFEVSNAAEDTSLFALAYAKDVQKLRPDVQIVAYIDVFPQADNRAVDKIYQNYNPEIRHRGLIAYARKTYPGRPLYSTFIASDPDALSISNGYFFQITPKAETNTAASSATAAQLASLPNPPNTRDVRLLSADYFGRQVLANFYYTQAAADLAAQNLNTSQQQLIQAIKFDQDPEGSQYRAYLSLRDALLKK